MRSIKKCTSFILAIAMLLSILAFIVSCVEVNVHITPDNDSNVQPDSSIGDDTGSTDSDDPDFIDNGNTEVDYDKLAPVSRGLLSTVRLVAHFERYVGYGQTSLSKYKKESSGVIYSIDREAGDAYIITNFHAVYHKDAISTNHVSSNIELFLYGQEDASYAINATYIGGSLTSEIAVLKVTGSEVLKHSHALAAVRADSNKISVFDDVFAVGNPEGLGISVTNGTISVEHDTLSVVAADGKTSLSLRTIRTSAAINEGNSGGGLYNDKGELIGIVVAKKTGDDIDNLAYAIPVNLATLIANIFIENYIGNSTVGFTKYQLGIKMGARAMGVLVDEESGKLIKVEEVSITELYSGSVLTDKVQLGDVITSIEVDGTLHSITRIHNVIEAMLTSRLGSEVIVNLERDGQAYSVTLIVSLAMSSLVS